MSVKYDNQNNRSANAFTCIVNNIPVRVLDSEKVNASQYISDALHSYNSNHTLDNFYANNSYAPDSKFTKDIVDKTPIKITKNTTPEEVYLTVADRMAPHVISHGWPELVDPRDNKTVIAHRDPFDDHLDDLPDIIHNHNKNKHILPYLNHTTGQNQTERYTKAMLAEVHEQYNRHLEECRKRYPFELNSIAEELQRREGMGIRVSIRQAEQILEHEQERTGYLPFHEFIDKHMWNNLKDNKEIQELKKRIVEGISQIHHNY